MVKNNKNLKSAQMTKSNKIRPNQQVRVANAAISQRFRSTDPKIARSKSGVRIQHREYITDFNGASTFTAVGRYINPSDEATFPWLASIANSFEMYRFNSLSFHYAPSCGTTTAGSVLLAVDYDPDDTSVVSKEQVMNMRSATRGAPWEEITMVCRPDDLARRKTLYTGATVLGNVESRFSNLGVFYACASGMSGGDGVGELYVTYDIELEIPQPNASYVTEFIEGNAGTFISATNYLNTIGATPVNQAGAYLVAGSGKTLTFKAVGFYTLAMIFYKFDDTIASGFDTTGSTASITTLGQQISNDADWIFYNAVVNVSGAGQTIVLTAPHASVTTYYIMISKCSSAVATLAQTAHAGLV